MKTIHYGLIGVVMALLLGAVGLTAAEDARAAAERIKDRLESIDAMKEAGLVGETAEGLLAAREALGPRRESLVEAENEDRLIIYRAVAKQTGRSVKEVGQQRALRIAKTATEGTWLQNTDGEWYRK